MPCLLLEPTFKKKKSLYEAAGVASSINAAPKPAGENKSTDTRPNWILINELYGTTTLLYFALSIIFLVVLGIVGYFSLQIPISGLKNNNEGWISFVVILVGTFITFNGSKYRLFLQGINKVALLQRNQAIISIVTILFASLSTSILAFNAWIAFLAELAVAIDVARAAVLVA